MRWHVGDVWKHWQEKKFWWSWKKTKQNASWHNQPRDSESFENGFHMECSFVRCEKTHLGWQSCIRLTLRSQGFGVLHWLLPASLSEHPIDGPGSQPTDTRDHTKCASRALVPTLAVLGGLLRLTHAARHGQVKGASNQMSQVLRRISLGAPRAAWHQVDRFRIWTFTGSRFLTSLRHGALLSDRIRKKIAEMAAREHGETHHVEQTEKMIPLVTRKNPLG